MGHGNGAEGKRGKSVRQMANRKWEFEDGKLRPVRQEPVGGDSKKLKLRKQKVEIGFWDQGTAGLKVTYRPGLFPAAE